MNKITKFLILGLVLSDTVLVLFLLLNGHNIALLNPKGFIARQEFNLILTATVIALSVAIIVFGLTFFIATRYKEGNPKAKYAPDWSHGRLLEIAWWAIPTVIILVLAIINWKTTHMLDPFKSLDSTVKPITIQVVALRWKWLFIYPAQNIATVNFVELPLHTPVNFELTAAAPMSSFWIPNLGGQMYAMTGMGTKLHLLPDVIGDYPGSDAEINGAGFAGMKFTVRVRSDVDFESWIQEVKKSPNKLSESEYNKLAAPSENNPVVFYSSSEPNLYNKIIMKYMSAGDKAQAQGANY